MDTYKFGSITGLGADGDHPDKGRLDRVRDYRDVFNPPDTGKMVERSVHAEPVELTPNYIEIARLVRLKKTA